MNKNVLPAAYNILSLDGGFWRGIVEVEILDRLSKVLPKFLRDTDFIIGTGDGGFITLLLAAGLSISEIKDIYLTRYLDSASDLSNIQKVLQEQFSKCRMSDLQKSVAVVVFDLDNEASQGRSWKPKVIHNLPGLDTDGDLLVYDIALASLSCPLHLPPHKGFIDGSVVAYNPALIGIAQALDPRSSRKHLENISLFSLGSGQTLRYLPDSDIIPLAPFLMDMVTSGLSDIVDFQCRRILEDRYYRMSPRIEQSEVGENLNNLLEFASKIDLSGLLVFLKQHWI